MAKINTLSQENSSYKAFICCSSTEHEWGHWLKKAFTKYKIPRSLIGTQRRDGTVGQKIGDVYLDLNETSKSSNLGARIQSDLEKASYLIVICSPAAARSEWIAEQIIEFKRQGKENRILSFIIDGEPNAINKPELGLEECFPDALKYCIGSDGQLTNKRTEPIAADARPGKDGKTNASLKILAGLLGVNYNDLRQREVIRKRRKQLLATTTVIIIIGGLFSWWLKGYLETLEKQQLVDIAEIKRDLASARKAISLKNWPLAIRLLKNTVISNDDLINDKQRQRIAVDLHYALQKNKKITVLKNHTSAIVSMDFSPNGLLFASSDKEGNIIIFNRKTWIEVARFKDKKPRNIWFSSDSKQLISLAKESWGDSYVKSYNTNSMIEKTIFSIDDKVRNINAKYWSHNRDYIIVKDWNDNLILKKLENDKIITITNPEKFSISQVLLDLSKESIFIFDAKKGLIKKELKTGKLLFKNIQCKHTYNSLPVFSDNYSKLVVRSERNKFILCDLGNKNINFTINTRYRDQVQFNPKGDKIWFKRGHSQITWDTHTHLFDKSMVFPIVELLNNSIDTSLNKLKTSYESIWIKSKDNDVAALTNSSVIEIIDISAPHSISTNKLPPLKRVEEGDHGFHAAYLNTIQSNKLQLLNKFFTAQGATFKLADGKVLKMLSPSIGEKYIVRVEKKIGLSEWPELTVSEFDSGKTIFHVEKLTTWAFDKSRAHLIFIQKGGELQSIDFSKTSIEIKPINLPATEGFSRFFGGNNKDYFIRISADYKINIIKLKTLDVMPPIQLDIPSEEKKWGSPVYGTIKAIFDNRFLLIKSNNQLSVINLENRLPPKIIERTQGASLYKAIQFPRILIQQANNNVQEIDVTEETPRHTYSSLPLFFNGVATSLSDNYLILYDYNDIYWINRRKETTTKLRCADENAEHYKFDKNNNILIVASSKNICVLDSESLLPVSHQSLPSKIMSIFLQQKDSFSVLLESGNQLLFKINLSLPVLLKNADNELAFIYERKLKKL
ncbi:MAG: toll/interleukin-1 receptor domain-containing protein [Gammaproteobacteria bacterium]|nr:toll/interleukin-1 receptor domain-containing protein [Gammaproteobacteria bacterium]